MKLAHAFIVVPVALVAAEARAQTCCLRGDANVDLAIDMGDVTPFVAALLNPSAAPPRALCAADANADGEVDGRDVADFVAVLLDPASALFDYGPPPANAEAAQIALEMLGPEGPLLAPQDTYDRIVADLALIRAHTPALAPETHAPAWIANQILVKVTNGAPRDDYNCLNAYYQMVDEDFLFQSGGGTWYTLTFAGSLNVEALSVIYAAAPEVEIAEPNGLIGGQNFWVPTPQLSGLWRWDIDDGFHDCFDGCDCHRLYIFRTSAAGAVNLISYQEVGQSWCEF